MEAFDLSLIDVSESPFIILLGRRRSGKTTAVKHLLHHWMNLFDRAVLFSRTERLTHSFGSTFPKTTIYDRFNPSDVQQVMDAQADDVALRGKNPCRMLLVLDDVLGDTRAIRCEQMVVLATEGRHLAITVVVTCQYPLAFSPIVRSNTDWVFCFGEVLHSSRIRMFSNFSGVFRTMNDWATYFDRATSDYGALVLKVSCNRDANITGNAFSWRASSEQFPPFTLGSEAFRHFFESGEVLDGEEMACSTYLRMSRAVKTYTNTKGK
jgi:hypothetical protein